VRSEGGNDGKRAQPPEVLGWWSADKVIVSVTVLACRPPSAVAAVDALAPDLARAAGELATTAPVSAVC
jgi:hypothetical protein